MSICHNCSERRVGCHSNCEKYQTEVSVRQEQKAPYAFDGVSKSYVMDSMYKNYAAMHRRKRK